MSEAEQIPVATGAENLGYSGHHDRVTPELVFVFVEPIGGGARLAAASLERIISDPRYGYLVNNISVSSLIKEQAKKRGYPGQDLPASLTAIPGLSAKAKEINRLQQYGNMLRDESGGDYLARLTVKKIADYRMNNDGIERAEGAVPVPRPLRVAHVVRSIKNEEELRLLRSVYGGLMFLIAVSGTYEQQLNNYRTPEDVDALEEARKKEYAVLFEIDQDEGLGHGQQVRDIFYQANLFLCTEDGTADELISKFLDLLFGYKIGSPTIDERMMFESYAASLRSTCLSRQVGAAIADEYGDLVSVGWNDVPTFGGGLACENDSLEGSSLCKRKGYCRSNREIGALLGNIYEALASEGVDFGPLDRQRFDSVVKSAGVSSLIEFSRAIHAEMEAILSAARTAKQGLRKGSLFVTTYPCENCVKHILAAGISRVVYIEPYTKSRALDFFSDFVVNKGGEGLVDGKLVLSQFSGISPYSYQLIYKKSGKRKNSDGVVVHPSDQPNPITCVYLDSFTIYESAIAREFDDVEE